VQRLPEAKAKLDQLRSNHGITFGFGMESSDKGFKIPGSIDITAEERMAELKIELEARDREMAEERKAKGLDSQIEIPGAPTGRAEEIIELIRQRQEALDARKAKMEREPSE
jgi:hypothetical protein